MTPPQVILIGAFSCRACQAEEAFRKACFVSGWEDGVGGILLFTQDNWDYVSISKPMIKTNIYGIVLNSHTEYGINPFSRQCEGHLPTAGQV